MDAFFDPTPEQFKASEEIRGMWGRTHELTERMMVLRNQYPTPDPNADCELVMGLCRVTEQLIRYSRRLAGGTI